MANTVETLAVKILGDNYDLTRSLGKSSAQLTRFGKKAQAVGTAVQASGRKMTMAFTVPLAIMGAASTKFFMDFDAGMRNVNTIAKQTESGLARTSEQVLEMSERLAAQPKGLTEALYNINSASFKAAEGIMVLNASVIAGKAGLASTADSAKAITAILNAYGKGADQATDTSDILFKTVEKGVLTFSELSQHLGSVVASGAAAGIKFSEISAGIATMTRGGINSAEAFTAMNRMIMRLIKGSSEMNKVFTEAGFRSANMALKTVGLSGVMKILQKATDGDAEALMKLGFRIRDLKAALSLTRNEGKDFAGDLEEIANKANRAGSTQAALAEQMKSLRYQVDQLRASLSVMLIKFGAELAPMVSGLVTKIKNLTKWFSDLSKEQKRTAITWGLWIAAIGPATMIIGGLIKLLGTLALAINGVGIALLWVAANPVVLAITAYAALVAVIVRTIAVGVQWKNAMDAEVKTAADLAWQLDNLNSKYGSLADVRLMNRMRWEDEAKAAKKAADALTPPDGRARVMSEEDFAAKQRFQDSLTKALFDQLNLEQKINDLMKQRTKLKRDIASAEEGTEEFFNLQNKAVGVESQLKAALGTRVDELREAKGAGSKFTAAVTQGSVEEYRLKIGSKSNKSVEKNTSSIDKEIKRLLSVSNEYLPFLRGISTEIPVPEIIVAL